MLKQFLKLAIVICAVHSIMSGSAYAQDNYVPNVLPPSPNAASLMKFADVPVSTYTGTADISVPIYTIKARGLDIPISLDYHTEGIHLKEEASSVGLGWALSTGGAISRTIMDKDDFSISYNYFTTGAPQLPGDMSVDQWPGYTASLWYSGIYFYDMFCTYKVNTTTGTEDFWNAFTLNGGANGTSSFDMEPDIYSYNFPGHTGKFILTRAGGVVLQKQDNIKISFASNGSSFTILDEEGNKFYFAATETMESATGLPTTSAISAWNISSIITNQADTVNFSYGNDNTYTTTIPDKYESWNMGCFNQLDYFGNLAPNLYYNVPLLTVDFANGQLQFVYDGNRSDLSGAKKLDTVKIYAKNPSGLTLLRENNLHYSYFAPPGYSQPWGVDSLDQLRLRLDSVQEVGGTTVIPPYSFVYNQPTAAIASLKKDAYSMDHWGFYNGVNNFHLIPTSTYEYQPAYNMNTPPAIYQVSGGIRDPDNSATATYTGNFSLAEVHYPTGGKTVFGYEPNDYDLTNSSIHSSMGGSVDFPQVNVVTEIPYLNIANTGTTTGTLNLNQIYPPLVMPNTTPNFTLDVFFMGTGNNGVLYPNMAPGKIYFLLTGPGVNTRVDISNTTCQNGTNTCTINQSIPIYYSYPGTYTWTAYIDPSVSPTYFSQIHVQMSWQQQQSDTSVATTSTNGGFTGGGLRIKTVTDYSSANVPVKERSYVYDYQATVNGTLGKYSYGRLMSLPDYARYLVGPLDPSDNNGYCWSLNLFGGSITPLSSVITGNIVGYDQVSEYQVDPVTGQDIGMTVYNYSNSADTPIYYYGLRLPGTFNMGNNLNGALISKTIYKDQNGIYLPVTSLTNFYHTTNRIVYYSPKYSYINIEFADGNSGLSGTHCPGDTPVSHEVYACFYPSIKSEKVLLDSTREITYDQMIPGKYSSFIRRYYYDNPAHYLPTRTNYQDSKGNTIVESLRHPQDYIPTNGQVTGNTNLDALISANRVAETIEKQDSLYYPGQSSGSVTGSVLQTYRVLPNNFIGRDKVYLLNLTAPVTNFQPFSINGNTVSMDSRYEQKISFDRYDAHSNLSQYTTTDLIPTTYIWDYAHMYPIANVINSDSLSTAYTSFEADGTGNWSPFTGVITTLTAPPFPPTGTRYYHLTTSATLSKSGLVSGNTYIISYWSGNGVYSISGGTSTYTTGKKIGVWVYYEHKVTATSTTLTITGTGVIDEVRLYPATAQMNTFTYAPVVGVTSACDADNRITYYFYDGLGRLRYVEDQDGNIIKTYQYHYENQTTN